MPLLSRGALDAPVKLYTGVEVPRQAIYVAVVRWLRDQPQELPLHDQGRWRGKTVSPKTDCGTAACIAGFVDIALTGQKAPVNRWSFEAHLLRDRAARALGIDNPELGFGRYRLFDGTNSRRHLFKIIEELSGVPSDV